MVVEGYFDVIALAQAGIAEAVAPLGTAVTEGQLELLWRQVDVPILCFDGDIAGQKAALRVALRALPLIEAGRSLAFATLPPGLDPDDLIRGQGVAAFEALLKRPTPLVDLIWQAEHEAAPLLTPEDRAGLGRRLRDHARTIRDEDVRTQYLGEYNRRLTQLFETLKSGGFGARKPGPQRTPPELVELTRIGVDQAVMAPAIFAGLLRHPELIGRHAETLARLTLVYRTLRLLREAMLDAALAHHPLESTHLAAILERAGLGPELKRLERKSGLAFSFLRGNAEPIRAMDDLSSVIDVLSERPMIEAELAAATARLMVEPSEAAFAEQRRLRTARDRIEQDLAAIASGEAVTGG